MEYLGEVTYTGDVTKILTIKVKPTKKDYDRVENLKSTQVAKMANSIKDPHKLIGRTKAYVEKYGTGNNPFVERMREMGFTDTQIENVANYHPIKDRVGKFKDFLDI